MLAARGRAAWCSLPGGSAGLADLNSEYEKHHECKCARGVFVSPAGRGGAVQGHAQEACESRPQKTPATTQCTRPASLRRRLLQPHSMKLAAETRRGQRPGVVGVPVLNVCSSFVDSPMTDQSIQRLAKRRGYSLGAARTRIDRACPGGRILTLEEVANSVAHLLTTPAGVEHALHTLQGQPWIPRVPLVRSQICGLLSSTAQWLKSATATSVGGVVVHWAVQQRER